MIRLVDPVLPAPRRDLAAACSDGGLEGTGPHPGRGGDRPGVLVSLVPLFSAGPDQYLGWSMGWLTVSDFESRSSSASTA